MSSNKTYKDLIDDLPNIAKSHIPPIRAKISDLLGGEISLGQKPGGELEGSYRGSFSGLLGLDQSLKINDGTLRAGYFCPVKELHHRHAAVKLFHFLFRSLKMSDKPLADNKAMNTVLARQSIFFNSLPRPLQSEMAAHFSLEEWKKGSVINPACLMKRFYTLIDGQIEMKNSNPESGREITLDLLYPGDSFDVITLLDNKPHEVTISPLTAVKLMSVPIDMMRKWLWTYPEMNQQFLPYLARKMRDQENLTTSIALYDVTTRLSRIILKHINRINAYNGDQQQAHQHHLINGMSDEALARMVGSVRQVVNKQLQDWKSENILHKQHKQLVISDLNALYREASYTRTNLEKN